MSVSVKVIDLTPEIAKQLMQRNLGNRTLSNQRVAMYADDMANGRWHQNGEPITMCRGVLKSGQHRCAACIKSGVTLKNQVIVYTDDAEMIDTGRVRSVTDLSGIPTITVSAVKAILTMAVNGSISKELQIRKYSEWKISCDYVVKKFSTLQAGLRKAGIIGACIAAHLYGYPEKRLDDFLYSFISGFMQTDIDKTAIALRNVAIQAAGRCGYSTTKTLFLKTQSALLSYKKGRAVTRIHELKEPVYMPVIPES